MNTRRRVLGQRGGIVIFHNALLSFLAQYTCSIGVFLSGGGANSSKKILTNKINQKKNGKGQLNSQIIKFMKFRSDHLTSISLSVSLVFLQLLTRFQKSGGATTSLFTFKKNVCREKREGRPSSRPLLMLCAWLLKTALADSLIRAP